MRQRFAWMSILLVALLMGAACGDSDDGGTAGGPDGSNGQAAENGEGEAEPVTVRYVDLVGQRAGSPWYAAAESGIADEHGVEIEFVPINDPQAAVSAIVSGEADYYNHGWSTVATLAQGDQGVRFTCMGTPRGGTALMAPSDTDLPTIEEVGGDYEEFLQALEGRRFGVNARGSEFELRARALLASAGLDPDNFVDYVAVGTGPQSLSALLEGQADIIFDSGAVRETLEADGSGKVLWDTVEGGPDVAEVVTYVGYIAQESWLEENQETADRVCAMLQDSREWLEDPANRDTWVDLVTEKLQLEDPELAEVLATNFATQWFPETLPSEGFAEAFELFVAGEALEAEPVLTRDDLVWP